MAAAEQLLTVKQAAARLSTSPMTVYRLIYDGRLKPHNIGRGKTRPRIRVREADLAALIESSAA